MTTVAQAIANAGLLPVHAVTRAEKCSNARPMACPLRGMKESSGWNPTPNRSLPAQRDRCANAITTDRRMDVDPGGPRAEDVLRREDRCVDERADPSAP